MAINEGDITFATHEDEHKPIWRYDVFLCFRGEDTRHTFTGNLYQALIQKKIKTFMDHEGLKSGDHISFILKALEESRIAIIVLSEMFATSTYCLDEVVKILECREKKNQLIVPIFYDVNPRDVTCESEKSSYEIAFTYLENERLKDDPQKIVKIQKWKSALSEVVRTTPSYGCWQLKIERRYEYERIEEIVSWVTTTAPRCDVFLSFRGRDTGSSFIAFLHNALQLERFKINMHDEKLEDVDQIIISESLIEVIEKSWLSIIVLSENYAYSPLCLDELVTILDCMKSKNRLVWPIFYKVEPSDIRHQRNSYGDAMTKHEDRFGTNAQNVQKWRSALSQVANLKGCHLKTGYEYEIIEKIVKVAINALYMPSPSSGFN